MAKRQAKLQEILESNGGFDELESWPPKVATSARRLLLWIPFSIITGIQPDGVYWHHRTYCWNYQQWAFLAKILTNRTPMDDEVWQHIQELLDRGAIHLLQSPWCNEIILWAVRVHHLSCKVYKTGCTTRKPLTIGSVALVKNGRSRIFLGWGYQLAKAIIILLINSAENCMKKNLNEEGTHSWYPLGSANGTKFIVYN